MFFSSSVFSNLFGLIFGFFIVFIGIVTIIKGNSKLNRCSSMTKGKIINMIRSQPSDYKPSQNYSEYQLIIEYNIDDFKFVRAPKVSHDKYSVGQIVEIHYNPNNHSEYYIEGIDSKKGLNNSFYFLLFILFFPSIVMLILVVVIVFIISARRRFTNLKFKERCSAYTYGKIMEIVPVSIGGIRHYDGLRFQPMIEYFVGPARMEMPLPYITYNMDYQIGQEIDVYYNPTAYDDFYVFKDFTYKTVAKYLIVFGSIFIIASSLSLIIFLL